MNRIKKSFAALVIVCILALVGNSTIAATTPITIDVQVDQTSAREAFDIVNQFRTGGDAWYWNESNTEKVMTGVLPAYQYDYALEQIGVDYVAVLVNYCYALEVVQICNLWLFETLVVLFGSVGHNLWVYG